jgi:hypothetical protein
MGEYPTDLGLVRMGRVAHALRQVTTFTYVTRSNSPNVRIISAFALTCDLPPYSAHS